MADQATTVDSQPTTEVVQPEQMDKSQRASWLRTGNLPETKIEPKKADSAPASEQEPPASEAGKQQPKRATATDRKTELAAEIQDLLTKRAAARAEWEEFESFKKTKTNGAGSSPATEVKPPIASEIREPASPEKPKRPELTEFTSVEVYNVAMDKYETAVGEYQVKKQAFEAAKVESDKKVAQVKEFNKKAEEKWIAAVKEAEGKHPDFKDVAFAKDFVIQAGSALDYFLFNADAPTEILYHLGSHRDEFKRISELSWKAQMLELAALEETLTGTPAKAEKKDSAAEVIPQKVKTITDAPKPPLEVGGKGTTSDDPMASALAEAKKGNTRRYFDLANDRDIARRKRGK